MMLDIERIVFSLFGMGVFAGLVIWGSFDYARLWRRVAAAYPKPDALPAVRGKILETIVITKRTEPAPESDIVVKRPRPALWQKVAVPFRAYVGVMLSVTDSGLLLARLPLFNFLCPPIYLPFTEMTISPTWWALWPNPAAIRMNLLLDTDIILDEKTVQWLQEYKT